MESNQFKVLGEFPGISTKLEYSNSQWMKINLGKNRPITEKSAKDIVEAHFPGFFSRHTLEDLKNELELYRAVSEQEEAKSRENMGWGYYTDEYEFIADMNRRHRLFTVAASKAIRSVNGSTNFLSRLKVLANRYNKQTSSEDLSISNIQDSFNVFVEDVAKSKKEELKLKLRFDPSLPDRFDALLDALRVTENREIHKQAIKHYIWQVKRKLWGFEPKYHFMLILFTSKQAFGKTEFLRRFHKPLIEVFANITGSRIRDQFGQELFENYYVACFDELSQLERTDIAMLKEFVTRKEAVQRKMHSQISQENRQNTTLCGTTNRPINQIVYDPSGMRRWWQIDLNAKDFDTMDFEQIERWGSEEFLCFWKSIDEKNDSGYYGKHCSFYPEMLAHQDSFRAITPVQLFVDQSGYTHEYSRRDSSDVGHEEIELDRVWSEWVGWCKATRNNPYTFSSFKNALEEIGFQITEHRPKNKTTGQRNRAHYLVIDKKDEGDDL
jgi:hypothetical protein